MFVDFMYFSALRRLTEKNSDVAKYFDKRSPEAEKEYKKLIKAYNSGHYYYTWIHGDSLEPRNYHLKRDHKIFRIKPALDLKVEFPGFMPNCSCKVKII
jgi:hypothetical protein